MELKVKLTDGAPLPRHAKPGDAGLDLTTRETVTLRPGETKMVGTGVSVEIPEGYFGLVVPRSGLGSRGVNLSNCCGIIDSGYRGEIKAPLHNNHPMYKEGEAGWESGGFSDFVELNVDGVMTVKRGERVCQLLVLPVMHVDCVEVGELSGSDRGTGGFGSTGSGAVDG